MTATLIFGEHDAVLVDTLTNQMLALYPDRANPGSLWSAAAAAKADGDRH